MADRKISDLTALITPASGDYLPIVDISESAAASKNKRITVEELMRGAPDGTAAAPSIAFESDPNTGIYSPGADQLAISTNGTQRLSIDSTGITRIGSGSSGIYLSPLTGTAAYVVTDTTSTAAQLIFGTSTNIPVRFHINDIERMRLDTSGRLGLGTSSWSLNSVNTKFGVSLSGTTGDGIGLFSGQNSANAYVAVGSQFGVSNANNGSQIRFGIDSVGNTYSMIAFATANGSTPVERVRIDRLGNVGIGTTSPAAALDVFGNQFFSAANPQIQFNAGGPIIRLPSANTLAFLTDSTTERVRIDSSGRLGLGVSSPTSLLHLADAGNITVGTTTGTKIGTATTQKLGFYNATPVVQPTAVADATDAATVITQLNALLTRMRNLGLIAT
jgi:hypothetical protein